MKRTILVLLAAIFSLSTEAQLKIKDKKYPSLMWEITGNGMKKPSYLFGTMHVSSKIAFHLPDSFYLAIRNAQVVALETNPESWQEDMSKYEFGGNDNRFGYGNFSSMPDEYLKINTLKYYNYDKKVEQALYNNPSTINNLLYRSYGNESSDFEEDTYLDMYIFQCGKKWAKKVTGVENYGESMKLMTEAYKDANKDENKKERSFDREEEYSADKLQEAYRSGNLDLLDSINQFNSFSSAFDEKFLYRRNEIQANSMDSIIQSGSTLFVGVGAAHLPGDRGVIELLRKKGYKLRPVKMGERDSKDKEQVEKLRVPVIFRTETADDGFFKVDIPGKFYKYKEEGSLEQKQYADMANGSYYMVTRITTNAWMWGHSSDGVYRTIDSLLYENIPGKIISKTTITRNGYKGFDIINRTRRGDMQRYNILITPFEIILFKMSGNGDYVKEGEEAKKFFGSIQLKEYKSSTDWKKFSPSYGGFSVDLPHDPYINNDGSWIYDAEDRITNDQYRIIRSDIHNYHFIEEDTFDLSLMSESFMASEFIDTELSRKLTRYNGYPALDAKYRDKNGFIYLTRFIIQGPHYYTLITHGKEETAKMKAFLNSFEIKPFIYNEPKERKDTSLYFTANTPVFPEEKKIKLGVPRYNDIDDDEGSENDRLENGIYRTKIISNDTTGEKIFVSFYHPSKYFYVKDSSSLGIINKVNIAGDSTWIIRSRKKSVFPGNTRVFETVVSDSGSSRTLMIKSFYRQGIGVSILTQSDTLSQPSAFVKTFFESFIPVDSFKGVDPLTKKSNLFFSDFMSGDSNIHKRAIKNIDDIKLDPADLNQLKKAITWLNWKEKKYLDVKKSLISKLGDIKTTSSSDYLKELYYSLDDTVQLQYSVLESLLQQQTAYSFNVFRDIINTEAPVLDVNSSSNWNGYPARRALSIKNINYDNGSFLDELSDSLQLTHTILPDLLPLLNLTDYKSSLMRLLGMMVDSGLVKPKEYEQYFSKFLIEARQELKKQSIAEKKKAIEKAEESKDTRKTKSLYSYDEDKDSGNDDLELYATLLLPFEETNSAVRSLIQQMLGSNDKRLKYSTALLLLRNNKPCPDSLLKYFASMDEYRYELYTDLYDIGKLNMFPAKYNNHLDLAKSCLLDKKAYGKPDSVVYLDRLHVEFKGKKGFIYFFKYKTKKDDLSWKLATVGLTPENPQQFEFKDDNRFNTTFDYSLFNMSRKNRYDFTGFTDTKVEEEEQLDKQLGLALKKLLYSRHKSAKDFYDNENDKTEYSFSID